MTTLVNDPAPAPVLTPRRCRVAHAWMTDAEYEQLEYDAARLGMHPDECAAKLLSVLIKNNCLIAVLEN